MSQKNILVTIALVLVFSAASFFGGIKYQESQRSYGRQFGGGAGGFNRTGTSRAGFRPVNGEILDKDDKSITVKLPDGSSKIVLFSSKTEINKAEKVSPSDLKTGEKVAVFGHENSDGTVTAQNIQLNPIGRMRN